MKQIKGFSVGEFNFLGAFVCASERGYNFLVSPNGFSIIVSDELVECLVKQKPSEDLMMKLIQHQMASINGKQYSEPTVEINPTFFIIDITNKCNFDCIYCFRNLDAQNVPASRIEEICQYILNYCVSKNVDHIMIQFWGGEPLLAIDNIRLVCDFFSKTTLHVGYDLETNGSLVTDEIAKELYERKVQVGVSIDGNEVLHNRQRRYYDKSGTFAQVKQGIVNLQRYYGSNLSAICVLTKHNIEHISEMIDAFVDELTLRSVKFNIVRDNPYAIERDLVPSMEQLKDFVPKLIQKIKEVNKTDIRFTEPNVITKMGNILYRRLHSCCISNGCCGGKKIVSFAPDGCIYPCEMTDFKDESLGTISDCNLCASIACAEKTHLYFAEKRISDCDTCPWWAYCKGGCSSKVRYQNGNGVDDVECQINKTLYPILAKEALLYPYFWDSFLGEGGTI